MYNAELCPNYFYVNYLIIFYFYISLANFQKPTILPEIVGFLKIVGRIQWLVQKRSQKIKYDVMLIHQFKQEVSAISSSCLFFDE